MPAEPACTRFEVSVQRMQVVHKNRVAEPTAPVHKEYDVHCTLPRKPFSDAFLCLYKSTNGVSWSRKGAPSLEPLHHIVEAFRGVQGRVGGLCERKAASRGAEGQRGRGRKACRAERPRRHASREGPAVSCGVCVRARRPRNARLRGVQGRVGGLCERKKWRKPTNLFGF